MDSGMKTKARLPVLFVLMMVLLMMAPACNLGTNPTEDDGQSKTFTMAFEPSSMVNPGTGNTLSVDIMVNGAINLIASRFRVTYDPTVLEVSDVSVSGWNYLFEEAGATVNEVERFIDNTAGVCSIGIGGIGKGFTGATGDGALASIVFTAKTAGATTLEFSTTGDNTIMSLYSPGTDSLIESTVQSRTATITAAAAQ
jgi:hypothetical protein